MKGDEIHIGNGRTVVVQKISPIYYDEKKGACLSFCGADGLFFVQRRWWSLNLLLWCSRL